MNVKLWGIRKGADVDAKQFECDRIEFLDDDGEVLAAVRQPKSPGRATLYIHSVEPITVVPDPSPGESDDEPKPDLTLENAAVLKPLFPRPSDGWVTFEFNHRHDGEWHRYQGTAKVYDEGDGDPVTHVGYKGYGIFPGSRVSNLWLCIKGDKACVFSWDRGPEIDVLQNSLTISLLVHALDGLPRLLRNADAGLNPIPE
jgi:hypothetical protein